MDGAQRRQHRAHELATFGAWQSARMSRESKLRRLDHYLAELKPRDIRQEAMKTISFIRQLKAEASAGVGMTIKKVDRAAE